MTPKSPLLPMSPILPFVQMGPSPLPTLSPLSNPASPASAAVLALPLQTIPSSRKKSAPSLHSNLLMQWISILIPRPLASASPPAPFVVPSLTCEAHALSARQKQSSHPPCSDVAAVLAFPSLMAKATRGSAPQPLQCPMFTWKSMAAYGRVCLEASSSVQSPVSVLHCAVIRCLHSGAGLLFLLMLRAYAGIAGIAYINIQHQGGS